VVAHVQELQQLDVAERDKNSRNEGAKEVNRLKNKYKNILPCGFSVSWHLVFDH
jgi:hypothetical protein